MGFRVMDQFVVRNVISLQYERWPFTKELKVFVSEEDGRAYIDEMPAMRGCYVVEKL